MRIIITAIALLFIGCTSSHSYQPSTVLEPAYGYEETSQGRELAQVCNGLSGAATRRNATVTIEGVTYACF